MATGALLIEVKPRLPHGLFSLWVTHEIGVTVRTAENYVRAASLASGCESEMISRLAPTTLYSLMAMPHDAKSEKLKILQTIEDDIGLKKFEADIRSACGNKNERPSDESNSDQLKAAEDIADLLKKVLQHYEYREFGELVTRLSSTGYGGFQRSTLLGRRAH